MAQTSQHVASAAVQLDEMTCRIGRRTILNRVDLTMRQGEITGILGPNGAGKTTLLSVITGLRAPTSGRAVVFGQETAARSPELYHRIGVVLQETALYEELTTFENLRFAASLYGITEPEKRIETVLQTLDLSDRARQRVGQLSGGLKRRVTIARALLHSPDLLVIDEPTLGVDVEARHTIWSYLRVLRSVGTSVVVSTNYLDEAIALCDTVAVLREGRVIVVDTPQGLVARAGSCLDIECTASAGEALKSALVGTYGILRTQATPTGLAVFLQGDTLPEPILRTALQTATIRGFRVRGADLAEVFHALEVL